MWLTRKAEGAKVEEAKVDHNVAAHAHSSLDCRMDTVLGGISRKH
jgi:hypothetical protein